MNRLHTLRCIVLTAQCGAQTLLIVRKATAELFKPVLETWTLDSHLTKAWRQSACKGLAGFILSYILCKLVLSFNLYFRYSHFFTWIFIPCKVKYWIKPSSGFWSHLRMSFLFYSPPRKMCLYLYLYLLSVQINRNLNDTQLEGMYMSGQ